MTPTEKAKELVDKMYYSRRYDDTENYIPQRSFDHAKQCAIIALDELMIVCSQFDPWTGLDYWYQVKQEIQKL